MLMAGIEGVSRVALYFNGGSCEGGDEDSGCTGDRQILN